jgi:hypothetical protein
MIARLTIALLALAASTACTAGGPYLTVTLTDCDAGVGTVETVTVTVTLRDGRTLTAAYRPGQPLPGQLGAELPAGVSQADVASVTVSAIGQQGTAGAAITPAASGPVGVCLSATDGGPDLFADAAPPLDGGDAGDAGTDLPQDLAADLPGDRPVADLPADLGGDAACGPLDTPANCGACGHDCLGGSCVGGQCRPKVLLPALDIPSGLAVDAARVYVANANVGTTPDGSILAVNKDGTGLVTLAKQQFGPVAVALDVDVHGTASEVYFVTTGNQLQVGGDGTLWGVDAVRPMSQPQMLTTRLLDEPHALAVDFENAYVINDGDGTVQSCGLGRGPPITLGTDGNVGGLRAVAIDGQDVYWVNADAGTVRHVPKDGSAAASALYTLQDHPTGVAVDDLAVYWANYGSGAIFMGPKVAGGTPVQISQGVNPVAMAVDSTHVYWLESPDSSQPSGVLARAARAPGSPKEVLARGQAHPAALVLDDDAIYWVNQGPGFMPGQGQLLKLRKPLP